MVLRSFRFASTHLYILANVNFHVRYRPSVCRLSVTLVRSTQPVEILGNISTPFGTLAIRLLTFMENMENFTEIVLGEPLRQGGGLYARG